MEETYRKSKGYAGQKGVQFQLDLVAVCLLNALRNHKNWKISSENPMAGKYDDIVVELDLESAVLIQAKHKENKKITKDQLLSDNSKNADFSLPKYFFSYEEVKGKFPTRTVIICTNTAINTKGLEDIMTLQQVQPHSVLYHESGCSFYSFNENILPDLRKSSEAYLRNNPRANGVDETKITGENLKDFIRNLQIFCCYPCEGYLHEIIEQSLSRLSCSSLCHNISSQEILRKVEDWFLQPMGEYLTETRARAMLCEIRSDKYCESLKDFNVSFQNNDLDPTASERIILVEAKEGYLLQMLKIHCALQGDKRRKLYVNPDDAVEVQKQTITAFSLSHYRVLIMAWATIKDKTMKRQIISKMRKILKKDKYKKIILVTGTASKLAQQFEVKYVCHVVGFITFKDLSKESQERLLKKEVIFQGRRVSLEQLLDTQGAEDRTRSLMNSAMLEELVRGNEIKVGVQSPDLDENTMRYYVGRWFETKTDNFQHILTEQNLCDIKEKMVVISDSAGMGKSTVITKMAVAIKKSNPSLWVVRINLNDYTKVLRDLVKTKRTEITAAELLNSLEGSKLTNQFENFVFSMSRKVVLLLDGVDEISPDYTALVLSLLSHCQEAPNFLKVFVTTRPHVDLKLKEVGLFVTLLPLSKLEQIDFLTNYWMHNLHLNNENKEKCKHYAEILLDKISSWIISDYYGQNPFTDVPLQVKMLAEIFTENIKRQGSGEWEGCKEYLEREGAEIMLPEKFNIAELYDRFIEKKRDLFIEKGNSSGSVTATLALLNQFESCLAYHRSLAVTTLLPKQQLFITQIPEDSDTEEYILKIGIVQRLGDRVDFIHRTFAEYFLAHSIVQELRHQNSDANFQWLLIDRILKMKGFKIVRDFLDTFLQRTFLPPIVFKEYRRMKHQETNSNLIFQLAEEGHVTILRLILESVDFKVIVGQTVNVANWRLGMPFRKRNTLNDLKVLVRKAGVNIKRRDGETPLHLAAKGGHFEMVAFLLEHGAHINVKNSEKYTALHLAICERNWNIAKYLVDHDAVLT